MCADQCERVQTTQKMSGQPKQSIRVIEKTRVRIALEIFGLQFWGTINPHETHSKYSSMQGNGKSTLLDEVNSVFVANPNEMNGCFLPFAYFCRQSMQIYDFMAHTWGSKRCFCGVNAKMGSFLLHWFRTGFRWMPSEFDEFPIFSMFQWSFRPISVIIIVVIDDFVDYGLLVSVPSAENRLQAKPCD